MTPSDRRRLEHMLEQIARIGRYTALGRAAFDGDERTQDAVLRCLTVIGEAAGALSPSAYGLLDSLPPHLPKGTRNRLVHEYWRIDMDVVWATVERELPPLAADIERLLAVS